MTTREIGSILKGEIALTPQVIATDTTTNGAIIDLQGFNAAQFYFMTGVLTDGDYTVLIQEGDESDLSDAAAVADADLTVTEASVSFTADTDDAAISTIGYKGSKRYVRFNVVSTSTSTGAYVGATVIKGLPLHAPTA
jgi:hypothetical protein